MSYKEEICKFKDITIHDILDISKKNISSAYRYKPWSHPELNHGTALLQSDEALSCYMAAYGEMHEIKCKTAFRNLPFNELGNIEVFDWGCGQGMGALCLAEMLKERDKLHLLRKVTLIEPSAAALQRAEININKMVSGGAIINPINTYLPSSDNQLNTISDLSYTYKTVIHIFSNILDIPTIELSRLAKIIPHTGHQQYIFCIGPKNNNSNRIELFSQVFQPEVYLNNIDTTFLGVTSSNKSFGCKAISFEYNNTPININVLRDVTHEEVVDEYDEIKLAVINNSLQPKAAEIVSQIYRHIQVNDIVYFSPYINEDKVSIAIVKPNGGVYIIQVFDYDITQCQHCYDRKNKLITRSLLHEDKMISSPIAILKNLKENLITLHLKSISEKRLEQKSYWNIITTIGLFTQNTEKQIDEFFNVYDHKYEFLWGNDINVDEKLKAISFGNSKRTFSSEIRADFINILSGGWHSYREGRPINLSREQQDLIKSEGNAKRKFRGIAGSGKTEVLVHRAVNAQKRTAEKVLILTFNLSLRNYIRHRLSQVREDFSWNQFVITNYHQLITSTSNNYGVDLKDVSYDDIDIFESVENKIEKYAAIFIDEIQDYNEGWLQIINRYFLKHNGELVVTGDSRQRLYDYSELDVNGDIRIGVIPGVWNGSLERSRRFSNGQIANLADRFSNYFMNTKIELQNERILNFDTKITYKRLTDYSVENIYNNISDILQNYIINNEIQNVVILTETHYLIKEIEAQILLHYPNIHTHTTSESQKQYEALLAEYGNDPNDHKFKDSLDELRKSKKLHFTMNDECLKLSTIHSYKGWEAENVILIVEGNVNQSQPIIPQTIYTGITRAKNNLHIISLGNSVYDPFFEQLK